MPLARNTGHLLTSLTRGEVYMAGIKSQRKAFPEVQPRLFTVRMAATYLSASVWAIRSLLWAGQLKYIPLGKRHLIDRQDLDSFIEREKGGPSG